MSGPPKLFDDAALAHRRHRATPKGMFLQIIARDEILERLAEVNRSFTKPVIITPYPDVWADQVPNAQIVTSQDNLGLMPDAYDLVVHAMDLHWANDPVGQLIQSRMALQPDGLFLAATLGGETLTELRQAMTQAESAVAGGLSPRVAPMPDIRDLGALLQRSGLALPVVDSLTQTAQYRDTLHLMHDLRDMGETNAMAGRVKHLSTKALFAALEHFYPSDATGLKTTYDLIFLSGWNPHESQQKPLRPGSGKVPFAQALNALKIDTDD